MNDKSFAAQYKDARWQRKRLEIMERDNFTCHMCKRGEEEEVSLNVHHAYYEKGKKPWDYPDDMLVTLCEDCHKNLHDLKNTIMKNMAFMSCGQLDGLYRLSHADDLLREMGSNHDVYNLSGMIFALQNGQTAWEKGRDDANAK